MAALCSLFHPCAHHTAHRGVREIGKPDTLAFRTFVESHQAEVFSLVFAIVGELDQSDVIAQDVFAQAYKRIARSGVCDHEQTWLYRLAIRRVRIHLIMQRLRSWLNRVRKIADTGLAPPACSDTGNSKSGERGLLLSWLQKLPIENRILLVLREIGGHSIEAIAEITRKDPKTVRAELLTARELLLRVSEKSHFAAQTKIGVRN
jgi:RNA polymerase sigma-70 factor (ECF subfamily)